MSMQTYWLEFLAIAGVHLLAVASPGPDFAVVLKYSLSYGRRPAIFTSIGIGLGILIHVGYSLLGIGLLIKTTPWLFGLLSYLAAAYLVYLGVGALGSQKPASTPAITPAKDTGLMAPNQHLSDRKALAVGILTNGLNPKATLFFVSLFAVIVSPNTPLLVQMIYGLYLTLATTTWFCILSYVLSSARARAYVQAKGYVFDRVMGLALIALAIQVILSDIG